MRLNKDLREVTTTDGQIVKLGPIDYLLLEELVKNPESIVRRDTLCVKVWGYYDADSKACLSVAITRLRQKLPSVSIENRSKFGYHLVDLLDRPSTGTNRCCPYLHLLHPDSLEYKLLACSGTSREGLSPTIDIAWAKSHCLENLGPFHTCIHYDRGD